MRKRWLVLLWAFLTIMTGFTRSFTQLYIVRVLFGFGEGVQPPCAFKLNSNWFPNKERATANAIFTSANSIGPAVANPFAASIIGAFAWRSIVYILISIWYIL
ncbi:MFS transporter [Haloimpatiens sp. FM7315]|uniref:MFS transporter n=1 Tax=Haloimpatiens sp. FM7315 TaxID=3298609 RepID=UPI0035A39B05